MAPPASNCSNSFHAQDLHSAPSPSSNSHHLQFQHAAKAGSSAGFSQRSPGRPPLPRPPKRAANLRQDDADELLRRRLLWQSFVQRAQKEHACLQLQPLLSVVAAATAKTQQAAFASDCSSEGSGDSVMA